MKKLLACFTVLALATVVFAQSDTGIAFINGGRGVTERGTDVRVNMWVAGSPDGIYGQFWYGEDWKRGRFDPEVTIIVRDFLEFGCEGNLAGFAGYGTVNGTPRIVVFFVQDNLWAYDPFMILTFHPYTGNLIYDRSGYLTRGRIVILCDGPGEG